MDFYEKIFGRRPMNKAGEENSTGDSLSPEKKREDDASVEGREPSLEKPIVFTDKLEAQPRPLKKMVDIKIAMPDPLVVTEKRQLDLSALHLRGGDIPVEARNVYADQLAKLREKTTPAAKEDVIQARSLKKDILRSIWQKKVEALAQVRAENAKRLKMKERAERPIARGTELDDAGEENGGIDVKQRKGGKLKQKKVAERQADAQKDLQKRKDEFKAVYRREEKKIDTWFDVYGKALLQDLEKIDSGSVEAIAGVEHPSASAEEVELAMIRQNRRYVEEKVSQYEREKDAQKRTSALKNKMRIMAEFRNEILGGAINPELLSPEWMAVALEKEEDRLLEQVRQMPLLEVSAEEEKISDQGLSEYEELEERFFSENDPVPKWQFFIELRQKREALRKMLGLVEELPSVDFEWLEQEEKSLQGMGRSTSAKQGTPARTGQTRTKRRSAGEAVNEPSQIVEPAAIIGEDQQDQPLKEPVPGTGEVQAEKGRMMGEEEIREAVKGFEYLLLDRAKPVHERINNLPLTMMPKSVGLYSMEGENRIFLPMDGANGLRAAYEELPAEAQGTAKKRWSDMNYGLESKYLSRTFLIALEDVKNTLLNEILNAASLEALEGIGHVRKVRRRGENAGRQKEWRIFVEEKEEDLFRDKSELGKPLRKVLMNVKEQRGRIPKGSEFLSFESIFGQRLRPAIMAADQEILSHWSNKRREFSGRSGEKRKPRKGRTIEGEKISEATVAEVTEAVIVNLDEFFPQAVELVDKKLREKDTSLMVLLGKDPERIEEKDLKRAQKLFGFVRKGVDKIVGTKSEEARLSEDQKQAVAQAIEDFAKNRLSLELKKIAGLLTFKE